MTKLPPVVNQQHYRGCLSGQLPAEGLTTTDREQLLRVLYRRGWSDLEVAVHTRMTLYTTVRIRNRIGLKANTKKRAA